MKTRGSERRSTRRPSASCRFLLLVLVLLLPGGMPQASETECGADLQILWNEEPRGDAGTLGFSIVPEASLHQLRGIRQDDVKLQLGSGPTLAQVESLEQGEIEAQHRQDQPSSLLDDPVRYDTFFAVDLSRSMDIARTGPSGQKRSRRELAVALIQRIAGDGTTQGEALLDSKDRLFVSGFDDRIDRKSPRLEADRTALRQALSDLLEHSPASENTALFASISDNLNLIRQTRSPGEEPREALLFVITDSFNGRDLESGSNLNRCRQNEALVEHIAEELRVLNGGGRRGVRLYILALGEERQVKGYSPESGASRSCRPTQAQKKTVDGFSFRALDQASGSSGGLFISEDSDALFNAVKDDFDSRWMPYRMTYKLGKGRHAPSSYRLMVSRPNARCEATIRSSGDIVPPISPGVSTGPSAGEMALLLASLMLSLLFVPRALTNIAALVRTRRAR